MWLQVVTVQAGGFGGSAPPTPRQGAAAAKPGTMYAQLSCAGAHLSLTLWPAFLLCNSLPCPVTWRIDRQWLESGHREEAALQLRTLPAHELPLDASSETDASLSFRLEEQV